MTRRPSPEAVTEARTYALPSSSASMRFPLILYEAVTSIPSTEVTVPIYVNYRLHTDAVDATRPFQAFQGSLLAMAAPFMNAKFVDVQLESEEPLPFCTVKRFFDSLEGRIEKH